MMKKGFTIIETLVAISIVMVAVVAPLTTIQKALQSAILARDQIVASYLAQDALEYVHYVRDTNQKNLNGGLNWLNDLGACIANGVNIGCRIDTTSALTSGTPNSNSDIISVSVAAPIYVDAVGRFSTNSTAIKSQYSQLVVITQSNQNPDEAVVTATISWSSGGTNHSLPITDLIYNR